MKTNHRKREHAALDKELDAKTEASAAAEALEICRKTVLGIAIQYPGDTYLLDVAQRLYNATSRMISVHVMNNSDSFDA